MIGIITMKDSVINRIFGGKEHVVEGIVVGDARGNSPDFIWEPSRKGIGIRTANGAMVQVYLMRHTLMPANALGWRCGDNLRIRGKLVRDHDALVFGSAVLEIGG